MAKKWQLVATPYPGRKKVSLTSEEREDFKELKIDLIQTKRDRSTEEVEKLVQSLWAVLRKRAISVSTRELDLKKKKKKKKKTHTRGADPASGRMQKTRGADPAASY